MITQPNKLTRGQALQEAFFYKIDQELIALLIGVLSVKKS